MSGTSAQRGFLPQTSGPIEDPALMDAFTATVSGITQISNTLVRPRWQPIPPNQPAASVDWCGIGVTYRDPISWAEMTHDPAGNNGRGQDVMRAYEELHVVASFYGPNANALAGALRRGLEIGQNRDVLAAVGVKIKSFGQMVNVPDLTNLQYIDHVDFSFTCVREERSTYNVDTLLSAQILLTTETGLQSLRSIDLTES